MATFTNFVFNVDSENPPQIGPSLSGSNNEVVMNSINAVVSGKTVTGILYNSVGATSATVSLSAATGLNFQVNHVYNGATFALLFNDRTTLFTVNTGLSTTTVQTLSNAITYDNRGPNEIRRFSQES